MSNDPIEYPPFRNSLTHKEDIVRGAFAQINEFLDKPDWIVKEYPLVGKSIRPQSGEAIEYQVRSLELVEVRKILNRFAEKLRKFIPENQLILGTNKWGEQRAFMVMRRVQGVDLERMKTVPAELLSQLEEIIEGFVDFYQKSQNDPIYTGYFPDLMPDQDDDCVRFGNLMWGKVGDKEGLYWIDTFPLGQERDRAMVAITLECMMNRFELEKGVLFSSGFKERVVDALRNTKKRVVK